MTWPWQRFSQPKEISQLRLGALPPDEEASGNGLETQLDAWMRVMIRWCVPLVTEHYVHDVRQLCQWTAWCTWLMLFVPNRFQLKLALVTESRTTKEIPQLAPQNEREMPQTIVVFTTPTIKASAQRTYADAPLKCRQCMRQYQIRKKYDDFK